MHTFSYCRSVNTVEFMTMINTHTQVLENGLRELRYELATDPLRSTVDIGTEVVILSGLREKCSSSMSHIEKLYEETKFLKSFLEKMESQAHYDLEVINKEPQGPGWLRRLVFISASLGLLGYWYQNKYPEDFEVKFQNVLEVLSLTYQTVLPYLTVNAKLKNSVPFVHKLVHE